MTFFGRYAASRRASFEPASSHAESARSRACRTYRDRAKGLSRGVRGGTKSAVPSGAAADSMATPAEGLSRRSAGRGSIASVHRPRVYRVAPSVEGLWPPIEGGGARIELTRFGFT